MVVIEDKIKDEAKKWYILGINRVNPDNPDDATLDAFKSDWEENKDNHKTIRVKNAQYRRYNIIPTLHRLVAGNPRALVPLLEIATEKELRTLKTIVNNIESEIHNLKRKIREPWRIR